MTTDLALVLLAAAIVIFIVNRPRMDAVALIMIVALPFTGVITVNEALAGFADPAVVPIAALFVIGEGLARTGVPGAPGAAPRRRAGLADWVELYALPDRDYRVRVAEASPLAGREIGALGLREQELNVLAIERAPIRARPDPPLPA